MLMLKCEKEYPENTATISSSFVILKLNVMADKYKDFSGMEKAARSVKVTILNNTPFKLVKKKEEIVHGQVSFFL